MNIDLIKKITLKYGFKFSKMLPAKKGYRNQSYPVLLKNGEIINLILYKNELGILKKIRQANAISNYLYQNNFPTRECKKFSNKKVLVLKGNKSIRYLCIYNYLKGETIVWEAYTMKHLKLLGKNMALMHKQLNLLNNDSNYLTLINSLPKAVDELKIFNNNMSNYFSKKSIISPLFSKLKIKFNLKIFEYFRKLINNLNILNERQVLHLDFVRGNILFSENNNKLEISGILDFEKTAYGPLIIDLARSLTFLIVDCKYKSEEKIKKYFLNSGYFKNEKFNVKTLKYLEALTYFFLVYDFYKFLIHNPYESLKLNEHYLKTEDKLKSLRILS